MEVGDSGGTLKNTRIAAGVFQIMNRMMIPYDPTIATHSAILYSLMFMFGYSGN
jgi:hypothetical protein